MKGRVYFSIHGGGKVTVSTDVPWCHDAEGVTVENIKRKPPQGNFSEGEQTWASSGLTKNLIYGVQR